MSASASTTTGQQWRQFITAVAKTDAEQAWCTPLILPSGGIFVFDDGSSTSLRAAVTFKLPCENPEPIISPDTTGNSSVVGFSNPFYASISPQIFALATATVISYILVILIFITPRTFYLGGPGGGGRFLGPRGIIPGNYGSSAVVGVGRRPLLQKIAAVTVAISLTIATADTFNVAEDQYYQGYIDSSQLVDNVVDSLEIRIVRVISDTFLWLAQVQTLIRLFPRHKEKVTIKWLGFAMVSFDTIFSILDSFVSQGTRTRPRSFSDAIPALNYLFELAISLIYASCVVYYCLSKRRFAFWHPKMNNICLVALLSLISVVIPVVFFILDISQPNLAGWGEYIRWVGAAAASVVVWEWVERIESLERDERKDGILGREIFDGDEMLNMTPSDRGSWQGHIGSSQRGGHKGITEGVVSQYRRLRYKLPLRKRRRTSPTDGIATGVDAMEANDLSTTNPRFVVPHQVVTPPNRLDTASATSTVYAVRYHNLTSPSPGPQPETHLAAEEEPGSRALRDSDDADSSPTEPDKEPTVQPIVRAVPGSQRLSLWQAAQNPFKRKRSEPPAEVAVAQTASGIRRSPIDRTLNLRGRFGVFASARRDRFSRSQAITAALPVTVIPAPTDSERTWSPDDVDEEASQETADDLASGEPAALGQHTAVDNRVVFVPVPANGRTWSPDDAHPESHTSLGIRRSATSRNSGGPIQQPQRVYTPQGSSIIAETDPRPRRAVEASHPSSPRSPAYARHPTIAPIPEDIRSTSGRGENGDQAPTIEMASSADPVVSNTSTANLGSASSSDAAAPGPSRLAPFEDTSARIETSETDGRNTGGTGHS